LQIKSKYAVVLYFGIIVSIARKLYVYLTQYSAVAAFA